MSDHKTSHVSKGLAVLLLLSLLAALLPAGVAGAAKKKCDKNYSVKRGDTLTSIANNHKLDAKTIIKANRLPRKYVIFVGQGLCIPDSIDNEAPNVDSNYVNVPAGYFTASRHDDSIVLYSYYPRLWTTITAGPAGKLPAGYTKLKNLIIENGKSYQFEMPDKLKNVNNLQVCVKSQFYKFSQCVFVH